jgi:uncharacterized protein YneF (UPF0154 family)
MTEIDYSPFFIAIIVLLTIIAGTSIGACIALRDCARSLKRRPRMDVDRADYWRN